MSRIKMSKITIRPDKDISFNDPSIDLTQSNDLYTTATQNGTIESVTEILSDDELTATKEIIFPSFEAWDAFDVAERQLNTSGGSRATNRNYRIANKMIMITKFESAD